MTIYDLIQNQQPIHGSVPELRGKPFVLYVWDLGCEACIGVMAYLVSLAQRIPSEKCPILGLCVNTDVERVKEYISRYQISWPQLFDERGMNGEIPARLNVESIPKVCLFDAKGMKIPTDLTEIIDTLIV